MNDIKDTILFIMIPAALNMLFWGKSEHFLDDFSNEFGDDNENTFEGLPKQILESISVSPYNIPGFYKSLETAVMMLNIARSFEKNLQSTKMNTYFDKLRELQQNKFNRREFENKKVLVLEGFSGSGKSTLAKSLSAISGARTFLDIPDFVLQVRDMFHNMPEPIYKAFEMTVVYFLAQEISLSSAKLVIVEQYYHSICADGASSVCGNVQEVEELPRCAFDWPHDLPQPSLVVFLFINTNVRMKRKRLGGGTSATQRSSDRLEAKDSRTQLAYSLVEGPPAVAIDANGTPDEVFELCLQACESYGVPLRPNYTDNTIHVHNGSESNNNNSNNYNHYQSPVKQSPFLTPVRDSDGPVSDENFYRSPAGHGRVSMGVYGVLDKMMF